MDFASRWQGAIDTDLLILLQRALTISILPSKRHENRTAGVEQREQQHSSQRPLDVTCTGAQVCSIYEDTQDKQGLITEN